MFPKLLIMMVRAFSHLTLTTSSLFIKYLHRNRKSVFVFNAPKSLPLLVFVSNSRRHESIRHVFHGMAPLSPPNKFSASWAAFNASLSTRSTSNHNHQPHHPYSIRCVCCHIVYPLALYFANQAAINSPPSQPYSVPSTASHRSCYYA